MQGDVTKIIDGSGNVVVQYAYDSWGKVLSVTGSLASTVGAKNPIRYRGYYYDTESELYYLNSRYYDPETGRFINVDDIEIAVLLGSEISEALNLYTYCNNNPVSLTDSTGYFWDSFFDAAFLLWSIYDVINNPRDWSNWVALGVDLAFAVIPFIPSVGGQVLKVGNHIDNIMDVGSAINKVDNLQNIKKLTVVGQSMTERVKPMARLYNAADNLYDGFTAYKKMEKMGKVGKFGAEVIGKSQNALWLYSKLRTGYTVLDIGVDAAKVSKKITSSSYKMEQIILKVWRSRNIWKLPINVGLKIW